MSRDDGDDREGGTQGHCRERRWRGGRRARQGDCGRGQAARLSECGVGQDGRSSRDSKHRGIRGESGRRRGCRHGNWPRSSRPRSGRDRRGSRLIGGHGIRGMQGAVGQEGGAECGKWGVKVEYTDHAERARAQVAAPLEDKT